MGFVIQWLRSFVFTIQMYVMLAVIGFGLMPFALVSRTWVYRTIHTYIWWVRWTASWMINLKFEVRGTPPKDEVIVGAKHHSFLDVLMIAGAVPKPKFIMKSSLRYVPVIAQYAKLTGTVAVERGKRSQAIKHMMAEISRGDAPRGQLMIYPQGTRVAPGAYKPYKIGTYVLYSELGQACVPVAANVGLFWGKYGIYKEAGTAIIEFLDPIKPGLDSDAFMEKLEETIEFHSNKLMKEAGFDVDPQDNEH